MNKRRKQAESTRRPALDLVRIGDFIINEFLDQHECQTVTAKLERTLSSYWKIHPGDRAASQRIVKMIENCGTCKFFQRIKEGSNQGFCVRHAPRLMRIQNYTFDIQRQTYDRNRIAETFKPVFPGVSDLFYCGDWTGQKTKE